VARIEWAVPCRFVEIQPAGGAVLVGAGIDAITVAATPATVAFMLAARLVVPEHEFGRDHEFMTRLLGPDMSELGTPTRASFQARPQLHHEPGSEGVHILTSSVRFVAEEPGRYTLEMAIDGRSEKTITMRVVVADAN